MAISGLTMNGFGVAFGSKVVLERIDLKIKSPSMSVIMGPVSAGKSTLLRTIAGFNDRQPDLRTWGVCRRPPQESIVLVRQNARFLTSTMRETLCAALPHRSSMQARDQVQHVTSVLNHYGLGDLDRNFDSDILRLELSEQRQLAVVRALISEPGVLLVDEIMTRLAPEEAEHLVRMLRMAAEDRAVICVTHNQRHAQALGGEVILLGGGRVCARQPTNTFFSRPDNELSRRFVRTGGLNLPNPKARPEELEPPQHRKRPRKAADERAGETWASASGFRWLHPGALGGCVRPGLLRDLDQDLAGLRDLGIRILVCLEENATVEKRDLDRFGLISIHLPVADMSVPEPDIALSLCRSLQRFRKNANPVALHCRAGLGRTGAMLACTLIYEGFSAGEAFERVREIHPGWIQSEEQIKFLSIFAEFVRARPQAEARH